MADQQAEQDGDFRLYVNTETETDPSWSRLIAGTLRTTRDRLAGSVRQFAPTISKEAVSHQAAYREKTAAAPSWLSAQRLPIALSLIWTLALGAYGVGYFLRLSELDSGARLLPTMDLLFFCFAIAGPVTMIWIVSLMLGRAERLTHALQEQSETTLALATTISTLNDSVDILSSSTTGKLQATCEILTRQAQSGSETLQKSLEDVIAKIDASLLDSVILLDRSTRDRMDQIEKTLASERSAFADRLDEDATAMRSHMDGRINETTTKLNSAIDQALADQSARLGGTHDQLRKTLDKLAATVGQEIQARSDDLGQALGKDQKALRAAIQSTAHRIQNDLIKPFLQISEQLDAAANSIVSNPPATDEALSNLLGEAASKLIRPERDLLAENLGRLSALEGRAEAMLKLIDRTSRLNPYMDAGAEETVAQGPMQDRQNAPMLPFDDIPATQSRTPLNWASVIKVLDLGEVTDDLHWSLRATSYDPDVSLLRRLGSEVCAELAEDEIHVADLTPDLSTASIWSRFAAGERSGDISQLAGIEDDISLAVVRGRLRSRPAFRSLCLRFAASYISLVQRSAGDLGETSYLVEISETRIGRAFMLVGHLTGVFDQPLIEVIGEA